MKNISTLNEAIKFLKESRDKFAFRKQDKRFGITPEHKSYARTYVDWDEANEDGYAEEGYSCFFDPCNLCKYIADECDVDDEHIVVFEAIHISDGMDGEDIATPWGEDPLVATIPLKVFMDCFEWVDRFGYCIKEL